MAFLFSKQDSTHALQGAPRDFHHHAFAQVRVCIVWQLAGHKRLERLDLGIRNRLGTLAPADDPDHARNLENRRPVLPGESGKAIARKQRDLDLFLSVFPLTEASDGGKEGLNALTGQMITHELLVTRTSP